MNNPCQIGLDIHKKSSNRSVRFPPPVLCRPAGVAAQGIFLPTARAISVIAFITTFSTLGENKPTPM